MKIKNLAFYGVMAAILGSVGTARADGATDSTIIASKGYVDAYAQKQSDRVETTWALTSSDDKASTDKYPSMATLNDAITSVDLSAELADLDLTDPAVDGKPIVSVSQADGQVSAAVGDITTAGIRSSALATSGTGNNNLGTAGSAVDTKLPTEKAVADALALKEDTSNKLTAAADGATVTPWSASTASDSQYPTVKAVAEQISAANPESVNSNALAQAVGNNSKLTQVAAIKDMVTTSGVDPNNDNVANNHRNNGLNGLDYASDQKVPSEKAVAEELALKYDTANTTPVLDSTDGATSFEAVANGQSVGVNLGRLDALKENKSNKQAAQTGNTVTRWDTTAASGTDAYTSDTKYPTVKAVAQQIAAGSVAPNTAITPSTDHSIVTYDAKGLVTGGISLPGLNDINNTSPAACTAGSPCVLSYYVDNGTQYYKWTNMDTEGLSGNPHVSGS